MNKILNAKAIKQQLKKLRIAALSTDPQERKDALGLCQSWLQHPNDLSQDQLGALYLIHVHLMLQSSKHEQTLLAIKNAIKHHGKRYDLIINHAITLHFAGHSDEAEKEFRSILETKPDCWLASLYILQILLAREDFDTAVTFSLSAPNFQSDKKDPAIVENFCNFCTTASSVMRKQSKYDYSEQLIRKGLQQNPNHYQLLQELAISLRWLGRYDDAIKCYEKMQQSHANIDLRLNRALLYETMKEYNSALHELDTMLQETHTNSNTQHKADIHWARASTHLRVQNFKQGWADYLWRWQRPEHARQRCQRGFPEWDGTPLNQRSIYLYQEQGYGDSIQFCRFASSLRAKGASKIYIETQPGLERLLASLPLIDQVFSVTDQQKPKADLQCPILDLPYFLDIDSPMKIPLREGYLKAPFNIAVSRDASVPSIGLAWSGNPDQPIKYWRDMQLDMLAPLFELNGLQFINLTHNRKSANLEGHPLDKKMLDISPYMVDFAATAALLEHVDLVITTCTSIAHLAGALGKYCWVMLAANADWRWTDTGTTTPWYTSMRLYRQHTLHNWDEVVQNIKVDLKNRYHLSSS